MRATNWIMMGGFFCFLGFGLNLPASTNAVRRVEFREPYPTAYLIEATSETNAAGKARIASAADEEPIIAQIEGSTYRVEIGNRLVLQIKPGTSLDTLLKGRNLTVSRTLGSELYILQASSSESAIEEAESLAIQEEVLASYPVMRRPIKRHNSYAPLPNDPLFKQQWHLENRDTNRHAAGPDLNVRAAWPITQGNGVTIAVADDGFQLDHPELANRALGEPHYNFYQGVANGGPGSTDAKHATAVAGLAAAEGNNEIGVIGVAPRAKLASWVIFGSNRGFEDSVDDEGMMDMFQYASNRVDVQNHSWGYGSITPIPIDALSNSAIQNAVTQGRDGRGEVIVRAAGNEREELSLNANDDAYTSDPRIMAVAAVRIDGRVISYSNPGACLLVGAPSGDLIDSDGDGYGNSSDPTAPDVLTTDRTNGSGYNVEAGDTGNYTYFNGTSASTPQIAGVAALLLSANSALTYRDVQLIFALSARHYDLEDPDVKPNGAGLRFSHNLGFGVPDAGFGVEIAKVWKNRPPASRISITNTSRQNITDDALRVICSAPGLPTSLASIHSMPSNGPHPDDPTPTLPLVYVGQANEPIAQDLHGKAALIQRGGSYFSDKIRHAAEAGASFAIIFNNQGTNEIQIMGGTAFVPIPAVSIGRTDGESLRDFLVNHPETTAQIQLTPAVYRLNFGETMICEHVGLRLQTTHTRRSDVRVTLVSPMGTRSVLQEINLDDTRGPRDWTYWSTQHFFESSAGEWRLEVSDERNTMIRTFSSGFTSATGAVTYVELIIQGVPISDADHDGLSDAWEQQFFAGTGSLPTDDPDQDGFNNAFEQALGTNPTQSNLPLLLEVAELEAGYWRISWPSREGQSYTIQATSGLPSPFIDLATVAGRFPVSEFVFPAPALTNQIFRVRSNATP